MDPITVSVVVDRPREEVFDYLQDIANHPQFTDHYLVDWHLTRIDSAGQGAGARFRVKAPGPGARFAWAEVSFAEVKAPHRIVAVGRTGKTNRVRTLGVYELSPGSGNTTQVQFTFETQPSTLSDRLLENFLARAWLRRQNARALRRLRTVLERGQARTPRVTVAAG